MTEFLQRDGTNQTGSRLPAIVDWTLHSRHSNIRFGNITFSNVGFYDIVFAYVGFGNIRLGDHSPNLPYSERIGSPAAAIQLLKVM